MSVAVLTFTRSRSNLLHSLMILVLIIVSTACQGRATIVAPTPIARLSPVTITFACRDFEREHYKQLAAEFHTTQPIYQVQVISSEELVGEQWDDATRILANGADTFTGWSPSQNESAAGLLRDLKPLIDADPGFASTVADYYPGALAEFERRTGLWGLPAHIDPLLVFYDRAAFDDIGMTKPAAGWTMPEFEAAAVKLTARTSAAGRYGVALISPEAAAALALRHDTTWLSSANDQDGSILGDPSVIASAEWLIALAREQHVMPDPSTLAGEHPVSDLVGEGQAAMWIAKMSQQRALLRSSGMNAATISAAPLPEGPRLPQEIAAYGFMMSAGAQQPQAAWAWLAFIGRQSGSGQWDGLPARRTLAGADKDWQALDPTWRQSCVDALAQSQPSLSEETAATLISVLDTSLKEGREPATLLPVVTTAAPPQPTAASAAPSVPTAAPATQVAPQHTIRFCATAYPSTVYEELGKEYSTTHPDTRIKVSGGGSFSYESSSLKLSSCDCFAYFVHGQFYESKMRDAIVNLQPFVDASNDFPQDFVPSVLETHRWENELFAIPAYSNVRVLFYNKDLFDKAGLPYPKEGWTLDDFRQTALRLTSGDGATQVYGYLPLDAGLQDLGYFVAQQGGFKPFDPTEYLQAPAALDAAQIVDAVRWYTGLALTDKVMPEFQIIKGEYANYQDLRTRRLQLIARAQVAMWTDALASSRTPAPALRFGIAPLPRDSDAMYISHPVGYMISSASKERETCWSWITFLTGEPIAVRSAPVRQAFLDSPAQLQPGFGSFRPVDSEADAARTELLAAYAASLPLAAPQPGRENGYLFEAFDAVMEGVPIEEAVGAALTKDATFQACMTDAKDQPVFERVAFCKRKAETPVP